MGQVLCGVRLGPETPWHCRRGRRGADHRRLNVSEVIAVLYPCQKTRVPCSTWLDRGHWKSSGALRCVGEVHLEPFQSLRYVSPNAGGFVICVTSGCLSRDELCMLSESQTNKKQK